MADLNIPALYVSPDVMQDAADSQSFLLKVPERAKVAGKNKFWTEMFDILSSEMFVPEDRPDRVCVKIAFRVSPESEHQENVARTLTSWFYLNYDAIGARDQKSKEYTMSKISLGKLGALLKAVGEDVMGGFDPREYFAADPVEGTDAKVQGAQFYGLVKAYTDKNGDDRNEIIKFDSLDAGAEG